ncbi:leucine Rich Repeat [Seminavis robusta]|uniref:Leucine Rich Repeat n=1 Tax=Seminavis robusta TaxID=568900 RepID=A0A9N8HHI3_9STRA|nr:leucine Rich Repeat [Seminavis robusta]|eukprot:Sro638_g179570.1 leucine Rich Repeat (687) ;mRNA; f:18226-20450
MIFPSSLLLSLIPIVAGGACRGEGLPCETVYHTVTCSEQDSNVEQCAAALGTCETVCERISVAAYDSPCLCNEDFQGCDGDTCDYEISCVGTINCAAFENAVHCSVTRGCKWDPSAEQITNAAPSPTLPPAGRSEAIQQYLVDQGISTRAALEMTGSPQNYALLFMAVNDDLRLEPPQGGINTTAGYEFVVRYALSVLFYSTLGQRIWAFGLNFLEPTSVCDWHQVLVYLDNSTEFRGVSCDLSSGHPVALFLNQNNMGGSLPGELGFVTTLREIDLDFNNIGGTIPNSYQQMTNMVDFFAAGNRLEGPIPAWIGNITTLENINLSTNYMTGELPLSLGNLANLEGLALDNNLFSSNVEDVFDSSMVPGLRNLTQFYLENNQLTGTLGDHFLREMTKLEYLDISDNYIAASIPLQLFTLPALKVLDLHDNDFTSMPTFFQENSNLQLLAMQKNQLAGNPVPTSINELKGLHHLDLSQNFFTGDIPSSIGDMTNLTYLFLAQNDFEANSIPYWIEGLTNLQELSLKDTQRTGTIPDFLGGLKGMLLLDLDKNNLMGTIPVSLGDLENLSILLLNRNNLTSLIPDTFSSLSSLKLLYIDANDNVQGDLDVLFCANPTFVAKPVIVASCDICDDFPGCCALCCEGSTECNTAIHVPDLDPIWQLGYNRVFFTFGREDYLDKNRDPNERW